MARDQNFPIAAILEKEKLHESGTNFVDWFRNVRIVLKGAKKDYVLEATLGDPPVEEATADAKELYQQHHTSMCFACFNGTRTSKVF
jgi:hypothetical protein